MTIMFEYARIAALAIVLSVALCGVCQAAAADPTPFSVNAARADAPPQLDGTLTDPAWQKAVHVKLTWDIAYQRPAADETDAYLLSDSQYLYVAFVAKQREPITATQHTNDIGLSSDDVVRTYFWPGGDKGFEYMFAANPIGTRYAFSSENTAFSPTWLAIAKRTSDGYIVTERIPFSIMRANGRSSWRLQFDRRVKYSDRLYEWAYASGQNYTDSSVYAGHLEGMNVASTTTRTKPRIAVYTLGQAASQQGGGSTSRMGVDFSLPVTPTASFFGTLHPDYSNVELDQQTISPTAFQRQFQEVRPFFTQGSNTYNSFNCNDCVIYPFLYTPGIPTPSGGAALEGAQGLVNFASLFAKGVNRSDSVGTVNWRTADHRYGFNALHESVSGSGLTDNMTLAQFSGGNVHNFSLYATGGTDRGSNITDPSLSGYFEYGLNLFTPKSGFFPAYKHAGEQFNPIDAFVPITDITGPSVYTFKEWDFSSSSYIRRLQLSQDIQRYHNRFGQIDDANYYSTLQFDTRTRFRVNFFAGEQWLLINGLGGYANQNGGNIIYANATATPSRLEYYYGRFGAGYLNSTIRSTTLKIGPRATSTFEADNTNYRPDGSGKVVQWLERASYAYQLGSSSSVSVGLRRIIGTGPYFGTTPQFINASNVSFAYYRRFGPSEVYLVYGDPNATATRPAIIVKAIYYFGAEKGT